MLDGDPLGHLLLDELDAACGRCGIAVEGEAGRVAPAGKAQTLQARPGRGHVVASGLLGVGRRVEHLDGEPAGEKEGRPAGADGPGANNGDTVG